MVDHGPCEAEPKTPEQAEIDRLRHELDHFTRSGIIEIAVRNPSVMEYMSHWERRAETAERQLAELRAQNDIFKFGLETLATTFYKGDQHQDYARHILGDASPTSGSAGDRGPAHRHVKSGHLVRVLGIGKMQTAGWCNRTGPIDLPPVDMAEVVIYEHDGNFWVRPRAEFDDGRFEALSQGQAREEEAK